MGSAGGGGTCVLEIGGMNLATQSLALSPNILSSQRQHLTLFLGINFQKVCSLCFQLVNTICWPNHSRC